jgi:hypothetical protein
MPLNKSWHGYNESLIERGRVLTFLKSSNKELKKMNKGKVGAPFLYSNSYVTFLAFLKIGLKIPYRMVQGIVRELAEYVKIVEEIHFTHIRRRMIKIKPSIGNDNDAEEPITLVVDASGDYIEEKWTWKKKEFIKKVQCTESRRRTKDNAIQQIH